MAPGYAALVLTPFWQKERQLLVRTTDAVRLCREDGCEELPRHQAEAYLSKTPRFDRTEVCDFIRRARITSFSFPELGDLHLRDLLSKLVKSADLAVVREGVEASKGEAPSLVQQRRLVRAIQTKVHTPLSHEGRRYTLVADVDLRRVPGRDSYEVVSQNEAVRVLDALAKRADPSLASLLGEAQGRLSRDWRPPLSPDGLVLLRKSAQPVAPTAPAAPPLTPSQLQKLRTPPDVAVAPSAQHEEPAEIATSAEREDPYELETGAEVAAPPADPADDEVAA